MTTNYEGVCQENADLRENLQRLHLENVALREQVAEQSKAADMIAEERDAWERRAKMLEADNAALREQVEAFRREQIARSKIDPVTRLHNLCDHLADQRRESPFTAEALELADASYKELCADNAALRAENARLLQEVLSPGTIPFNWQKIEADNAALKQDAERWRFLRMLNADEWDALFAACPRSARCDELDTHVDAAMREGKDK